MIMLIVSPRFKSCRCRFCFLVLIFAVAVAVYGGWWVGLLFALGRGGEGREGERGGG